MSSFKFCIRPFLAVALIFTVSTSFAYVPKAHSQFSPAGPVSVADLAEKLIDSVVNISTVQVVKPSDTKSPNFSLPPGSPFHDLFKEFLEKEKNNPKPRKSRSLGSGFVIDSSGIIVTNNHVVAKASEIMVKFSDGTQVKAKIIGRDPKTDLALLKIKPPKGLKAVPLGDSAKMRVGDWVMAIGNPFGLGGSVSMGIISARNRDINAGPYDDFLQTDAAINKGNSGGPLFNMKGEVVGINTAIISPNGGSIGIGFSVPSSTANPVIAQLRKYGETRRGWLGVRIQTVSSELAEGLGLKEAKGALVADIIPGSPAERAKFLPGDIILKFNGKDVDQMRDLPRIVAGTDIGDTVDVLVLRKGSEKTLKVKIGRLEDSEKKTVKKVEQKKPVENTVATSLGLSVSELGDVERKKYKIKAGVKGVVITKIDPASTSAGLGLRAGDVIVQVSQKPVVSTEQFVSRVKELKKAGKKVAVLFVTNGRGEYRFVAVRLK